MLTLMKKLWQWSVTETDNPGRHNAMKSFHAALNSGKKKNTARPVHQHCNGCSTDTIRRIVRGEISTPAGKITVQHRDWNSKHRTVDTISKAVGGETTTPAGTITVQANDHKCKHWWLFPHCKDFGGRSGYSFSTCTLNNNNKIQWRSAHTH